MQTYIFAYAKLYVLHKYMFLHMQKYIPCTKHIVLQMYMVLHAAGVNNVRGTKQGAEFAVAAPFYYFFFCGGLRGKYAFLMGQKNPKMADFWISSFLLSRRGKWWWGGGRASNCGIAKPPHAPVDAAT